MIKGAGIVLGIALAGAGLSGCVTPSYIPEENRRQIVSQVSSRNYVAIFDGLTAGGWAIDIQNSLGPGYVGFATAGNQGAHMPIIEKFYGNGRKPSIVGFSLGGDPAISLAEECKRKGIGVKTLILLDPYTWKNVPDNVERVVEIRGTAPYIFRMGQVDSSRLENPAKTALETRIIDGANHFSLPREAITLINLSLHD